MASSSFLYLALASLLLFNVCFAQMEQFPLRSRQESQQRKLQWRWQTECRLDSLNALQPARRVESEAGVSDYWDLEIDEQLQCAGVSAVRHTIHRRGLMLPFFTNAPVLTYVIQGRGIQGAVIPGCPETYEVGQSQQSQRSQEQHQKVREIREGDIVATPVGVAQWVYDNGDSPLVVVSFIDFGNQANQLDLSARIPPRRQPTKEATNAPPKPKPKQKKRERRNPNGNIFSGFDERLLAEAFNIDTDLARRLQSQGYRRERIVRVKEDELQVLSPARIEEEERRHDSRRRSYDEYNGVEETFCTLRMRHNIDRQSQADIFNPRGGRVTTVNSFNLPILRFLQLTAERGVLYRGSCRCQIVDDFGRNVFDCEVREGQLLVVPQNYTAVKQASSRGFEWIAVKTNDNAMRNPLVANAFRISREQARNLKNNREEVTMFST